MYAKGCGCPSMDDLRIQVMQTWPTPQANDASRGADTSAMKDSRGAGGPNLLGKIVETWPTPDKMIGHRAGKATTWGGYQHHRAKHAKRGVNAQFHLNAAVSGAESGNWPTPTRKDGDNDTLPPSQMNWDSTVGAVMRGLRDQDKSSTSGKSRDSSILHAAWVGQLMGYPPGWTDLPADTIASLFARTGMQSSPPSSRPSAAGS